MTEVETADEPQEEIESEDAETETDESQEGSEEKPRKQTFKERFNEVYAKQKEAEREAQFWRMRAEQNMQPQQQPTPKVEEQEPLPPDPNKFQDGVYDPQYAQANARYTAELAAYRSKKEVMGVQEQARQEAQQQATQAAFREKASALGEEGQKALQLQRDAQQGMATVTDDVGRVLTQAENGIQIAAYLNDNRHELMQLNQMDPVMRVYELANIGARLSAQSIKTTQAPQPFPTADGITGKGAKSGNWKSQAEYENWRKGQKAKR